MSAPGAIQRTPSENIRILEEMRQKQENRDEVEKLQNEKGVGKGRDKMKEALANSEGFRDMHEHKIEANALLNELGCEGKEVGMTTEAVRKRIQIDGENKLTEKVATPWYIMFIKQLTGLFSLLLWLGAILCFIGYSINPTDPSNLWLGIVLATVVMITGIFSYTQESKSASIMAKFKNFVPPKCTVLRDNGT
jgi:sodium/potassium-transporting ATPase subunit alpha